MLHRQICTYIRRQEGDLAGANNLHCTQLRDLRLLDPQLSTSYPSAILCREKALVVNLEHIKCIITLDHVLVLNADEENVITFIEV